MNQLKKKVQKQRDHVLITKITLSGIPSSKLFFQNSLGITTKQKNYHMSLDGVYIYRRIIQKKFERYIKCIDRRNDCVSSSLHLWY